MAETKSIILQPNTWVQIANSSISFVTITSSFSFSTKRIADVYVGQTSPTDNTLDYITLAQATNPFSIESLDTGDLVYIRSYASEPIAIQILRG